MRSPVIARSGGALFCSLGNEASRGSETSVGVHCVHCVTTAAESRPVRHSPHLCQKTQERAWSEPNLAQDARRPTSAMELQNQPEAFCERSATDPQHGLQHARRPANIRPIKLRQRPRNHEPSSQISPQKRGTYAARCAPEPSPTGGGRPDWANSHQELRQEVAVFWQALSGRPRRKGQFLMRALVQTDSSWPTAGPGPI